MVRLVCFEREVSITCSCAFISRFCAIGTGIDLISRISSHVRSSLIRFSGRTSKEKAFQYDCNVTPRHRLTEAKKPLPLLQFCPSPALIIPDSSLQVNSLKGPLFHCAVCCAWNTNTYTQTHFRVTIAAQTMVSLHTARLMSVSQFDGNVRHIRRTLHIR